MFHVKHGSSPARGALASDLHLRLTNTPITRGSPRAAHESARSSTRTDSDQHLPGHLHPFALRTCSMTGLRPSHCRNRPGSVAAPKPRMHGSTETRRMFPCRAAPCLSSWVRSAARSERDDPLCASHGRTLLRHRTQVTGTPQARYAVLTSFEGSLWSAPRSVLPARFRGPERPLARLFCTKHRSSHPRPLRQISREGGAEIKQILRGTPRGHWRSCAGAARCFT
jgi:hypothetical protein